MDAHYSFRGIYFHCFIFHRQNTCFFPKLVTGSLVTIVGFSLVPIALNDVAGGFGSPTYGSPINLALGAFVLVIVILINKFF